MDTAHLYVCVCIYMKYCHSFYIHSKLVLNQSLDQRVCFLTRKSQEFKAITVNFIA